MDLSACNCHVYSTRSTSFHSLFNLLQHGHCSYFYVCANTLTILFLAEQAVGSRQSLALITPTTSGFRAAMKKQGVKFAMPLATEAQRKEHHLDELEGDNKWLKSMVTPDTKTSLYPLTSYVLPHSLEFGSLITTTMQSCAIFTSKHRRKGFQCPSKLCTKQQKSGVKRRQIFWYPSYSSSSHTIFRRCHANLEGRCSDRGQTCRETVLFCR